MTDSDYTNDQLKNLRERLERCRRESERERRTREMLAESDGQIKSLFDNALIGMYRTTPGGRILSANPALVEMLGFDSFEELSTCDLEQQQFYSPDFSRAEYKRMMDEKNEMRGMECRWVRKDGSFLHVRESSRAVRDEDGEILYYEGTVEDMSQQKQMEEKNHRLEAQLRQQQKLEAIGTLASGVAHEINNPINVIINFAQMIIDRTREGYEIHEFAQEIMSESNRIAEIVSNLLAFARQERETRRPCGMPLIINRTLMLTGQTLKKNKIRLLLDFAEDLPEALCNDQQIQQVLLNLITNARDSLNERYGDADHVKKIHISVNTVETDGKVFLHTAIEDNGMGIEPGIIDRIFDPFFTTKPRDVGTGLGLSISHGIVRDHGGTLHVESRPGEFARFYFDLPVSSE